ncbi:hypothetical protein FLJC2902T_22520 [Flavobacterium limnosediminis JC2902]|uniref:Endonuclease GajA/Old nuclease/RecF-like AAA domain-containing protein n=1 Tax=Flavobacterium limnosediminis JC2902 TaxID=1341181 RepID=V6SKU9_9FLAO|nr:AAA family ATPase [Flavobacterium limnosediminis]ESU27074.1 hypothetical protein FLJC2902T_22520 [Flavobacterium limnosediminis JC2902]
MIKKIHIQNFKSIINTSFELSDNLFTLAGQNEAGKSSILEALYSFEDDIVNRENLNFEEESNGNLKQSISITYKTSEFFFKELEKECRQYVNDELKTETTLFKVFDVEKLKKLQEFTLTKTIDFGWENQNEYKLEINEPAFQIIKSAINNLPNEKDDFVTAIIKILRPIIDINLLKEKVVYDIWRCCPSIIFFDDVADLLPDEIYVDELEKSDSGQKGIKAVKNFQEILKINFVEFSKKNPQLKKGKIETLNKELTASFQKDWKQKISGNKQVEINFELAFDQTGKEKVSFFVKSKDGQYLQPRRRSKGLIWFLSLWLELKASESENGIVFLFDEPGQNLHVKANNDMLEVFENLAKSGHQIIYSTHSPSLIKLDKLHNIGLVLNTENEGTIVEGLTTSKLDSTYKKDALQPISEAMGLEPLKDFSILSEKNVLLEGLSDFWYFESMAKILNKKKEYKFVPGIGIKSSKIYPLISFCIGYGLDWILLMDNGVNPRTTREELKENLFNNDEILTDEKIKLIDFKEVEDMFSTKDFLLVDDKFNIKSGKTSSEIIGNSRKIIYAKQFYQNVINKKITKSKLDEQTIQNFEKVFDFIDQSFSKNIQNFKVPQKNIVEVEGVKK